MKKLGEPYSIGRYAVDGASSSWRVEEPHNIYRGVFQNHITDGHFDWAYGHNRMCNPGSRITVNFGVPVDHIRMVNPDAKIILRTRYFGPWNMSPCIISIMINGEKVIKNAQVLGEHKGRTTHDIIMEDLISGTLHTVTIIFERGNGVLFLWDFDILVQNYTK